jgi:hypothetical protein
MLQRRVWLDCGSSLLASELASPWCFLLLGGGLLITSLRFLPPPPDECGVALKGG